MNPSPEEIRAAREATGLTQTRAARLVHRSLRAWQEWEAGRFKMPQGLFELFKCRTQLFTELGFTADEAKRLRRISRDLHRWHEMVRGTSFTGRIERDEESGQPFWRSVTGKSWPIQDGEASAKKRLAAIMARHPELGAYVQPDPHGVALYILRPGDVPPGGDVRAYYTRGIAVG